MVEQVAVQLGRVAERERTQASWPDARDGALAASRQKSGSLAAMSHEIRTPLNGVIGLNDLLLRPTSTPTSCGWRRGPGRQPCAAQRHQRHLGLLEDRAGKLELERLDFEVRPVFDQVASLLAEAARAKGLELMVSCHPDVPEVLAGDPTRLAQVLTNLGSNAVKFTDAGEVSIRATAEATDEGRTRLRVTVADTGVGVPGRRRHALRRLHPGRRLHDPQVRRHRPGPGDLREIVEALGGEIGLEPNRRAAAASSGSPRCSTRPSAPPGPRRRVRPQLAGGRRVLVVDDNDNNRLILEEQLAWWRGADGRLGRRRRRREAMAEALAGGDPFDAVLLDMSMPGATGSTSAQPRPAAGVRRGGAPDAHVATTRTPTTCAAPASSTT